MEQKRGLSELYKVTEVDLVYRSKVKACQRPMVSCSSDAYALLKQLWDKGKIELVEEFKVLLLNRANRVLGVVHVSTGGVSGTVADPKIIYMAALKANACAIVICHNHPSGSVKPSVADEELTQKIKNAGHYLDIRLLDHLVITEETYFSFADEGLL